MMALRILWFRFTFVAMMDGFSRRLLRLKRSSTVHTSLKVREGRLYSALASRRVNVRRSAGESTLSERFCRRLERESNRSRRMEVVVCHATDRIVLSPRFAISTRQLGVAGLSPGHCRIAPWRSSYAAAPGARYHELHVNEAPSRREVHLKARAAWSRASQIEISTGGHQALHLSISGFSG